MTDDDYCIGSREFSDAGHLAIKDGTGLGVFGCGNVDAVIGHGNFIGNDRGMFAISRRNHTTLHRPRQFALVVDEVRG